MTSFQFSRPSEYFPVRNLSACWVRTSDNGVFLKSSLWPQALLPFWFPQFILSRFFTTFRRVRNASRGGARHPGRAATWAMQRKQKERMVAAQFDSYYPVLGSIFKRQLPRSRFGWTNVASMQHRDFDCHQPCAVTNKPRLRDEARTLLRAPASPEWPPIHQRDRWQKIAASQIDGARNGDCQALGFKCSR